MTKRDIKSIILYLDSAEAIEYLTNEQTGILMKAVFRYARTGQKLESSDTALIALFTIMCAQIDRDHKKYEERCERNVANAVTRIGQLASEMRLSTGGQSVGGSNGNADELTNWDGTKKRGWGI